MSPRYQWTQDQNADDQPVSRSQRKRDSLALQSLGEELTRYSDSVLACLPLSDDVRAAITEWRHTPSHEAKRRQLQYVGRLMREVEHPEAIMDAMETLRRGGPHAAKKPQACAGTSGNPIQPASESGTPMSTK